MASGVIYLGIMTLVQHDEPRNISSTPIQDVLLLVIALEKYSLNDSGSNSIGSVLLSALCPLAIVNEHRDADHRQPKPICKRTTGIAAHHAPNLVVIHELAKEARTRQPCERAEVNRGFCMPTSGEHAAWSRTQRDHVAWACKVVSLDRCSCGGGRSERAGSECPVVR